MRGRKHKSVKLARVVMTEGRSTVHKNYGQYSVNAHCCSTLEINSKNAPGHGGWRWSMAVIMQPHNSNWNFFHILAHCALLSKTNQILASPYSPTIQNLLNKYSYVWSIPELKYSAYPPRNKLVFVLEWYYRPHTTITKN